MKKYWVYVHTCPNGKKYVGLTSQTDPEMRWQKGRNYRGHFYSAILKFGWNNIEHKVYEVDTREEMLYLEKYLIAFYNTLDPERGYNLTTGGEHYIFSPEVRKKLSEQRKSRPSGALGTKHTEEWKKHHSEVMKGKKFSEEHRQRVKEANRLKAQDPEYRKKISEGLKGKPKQKYKWKFPDGSIREMSKAMASRFYLKKGIIIVMQ